MKKSLYFSAFEVTAVCYVFGLILDSDVELCVFSTLIYHITFTTLYIYIYILSKKMDTYSITNHK